MEIMLTQKMWKMNYLLGNTSNASIENDIELCLEQP